VSSQSRNVWLPRPGGLLRNVLTVATGTAVAQALSMAFAPLLTRLYGPEAFGIQAVFLSMVGLLVALAPLGYQTAIVLPERDDDALSLVRLSMLCAAIVCAGAAALLLLAGRPMLRLLGAGAIAEWRLLLPVATFAAVAWNVQMQWFTRKKAFGASARLNVLVAVFGNLLKSGAGLLNPSALLLIGANILATAAGTVLACTGWNSASSQKHTDARRAATVRALAWQHRDFPLLRTPQDVINLLSQSLPVLLLSGYFGAAAAGQYSIAISVLGVPAALIGGSVLSVFYPRVTEAIRHGEDARTLIVKTTTAMAWTGALPLLAVAIFGPALFRFVFGQQWGAAGTYAQWLSPWLFLQYVNKPAVAAVPALGLQGGLLLYELASTGTKVLALWLGFRVFRDPVVAVALFSGAGVAAYLWLILWVVRRSRVDTGA
jgi:O-antigen/teichoic acid export membrane protein